MLAPGSDSSASFREAARRAAGRCGPTPREPSFLRRENSAKVGSPGQETRGDGKGINYGQLMHKALRQLMAEVLAQVARDGLPGKHHFFITFDTTHPGRRHGRRAAGALPQGDDHRHAGLVHATSR